MPILPAVGTSLDFDQGYYRVVAVDFPTLDEQPIGWIRPTPTVTCHSLASLPRSFGSRYEASQCPLGNSNGGGIVP